MMMRTYAIIMIRGGIIMICQALVGMMSSLLFSRLGNRILAHNFLVRINVANVLFGNTLIVFAVTLPTSPDDVTVASQLAIASELAFVCWFALTLLVVVCTHLLAFPFWARCCITPAFAIKYYFIALSGRGPLSSLGPQAEQTLLIIAALSGEALGYLLQLSARQQYLERLNEKEVLRIRTEQLQNEKERLDFERQMALRKSVSSSMGGHADPDPFMMGRFLAGCGGSFRDDISSTSGLEDHESLADSVISYGTHPELVDLADNVNQSIPQATAANETHCVNARQRRAFTNQVRDEALQQFVD